MPMALDMLSEAFYILLCCHYAECLYAECRYAKKIVVSSF